MIKDLLTTKHNELWLTFLKLQNSEANVLSLNLWNDYGLCEYGIPLSGFFQLLPAKKTKVSCSMSVGQYVQEPVKTLPHLLAT